MIRLGPTAQEKPRCGSSRIALRASVFHFLQRGLELIQKFYRGNCVVRKIEFRIGAIPIWDPHDHGRESLPDPKLTKICSLSNLVLGFPDPDIGSTLFLHIPSSISLITKGHGSTLRNQPSLRFVESCAGFEKNSVPQRLLRMSHSGVVCAQRGKAEYRAIRVSEPTTEIAETIQRNSFCQLLVPDQTPAVLAILTISVLSKLTNSSIAR